MKDWMTCRSPFCVVFAVCLMTGARRSEIAEATWDEVDLDEGLIRLGPNRTKQRRLSLIVLPKAARDMLARIPRTHPRLVFPTPYRLRERPPVERPGRAGRGVISGWATAHRATMKRTGTEGWTPHDLRRTFATGLARMGVSSDVIEAALNHTRPVLIRTYQVHVPLAEVREAVEAWASSLLRAPKCPRGA